jgi:hypothetical protein
MGGDDVYGPAFGPDAHADRGAIIRQRFEPAARDLDHRQARQDRIAIAPGCALGLGRDKVDLGVAKIAGERFRLIRQVLLRVFEHFLQRDDVGVCAAQRRDEQCAPRRPMPARVVPDIEGRNADADPRAVGERMRAGGERERRDGCKQRAPVKFSFVHPEKFP